MPSAIGLMAEVKKTAIDAVESKKPVNMVFGTVTSINPLMIQTEQKMTLGKRQLILSRNVTNYTTTCMVNWDEITGKKTITINNSLVVGDKVILVREQGGQHFFVLDRCVP